MRRVATIAVCAILVVLIGLAGFRLNAGFRESFEAKEIAPKTGRFVLAGDVDFFVQEAGPTDGVAVVLIHGTGAWSETWRDTINALAQAGFRAIALDLPPFGFSQRPGNSDYSKLSQGRRIIGMLDSMGIGRAVLVGHSFGGGPTVEAALLNPDRIRALVLVDAALGIENGEPAKPSWSILSGVLHTAPLRNALVATFLTNPMFTQRLVRSFVAHPEIVTDARAEIYRQPLAVKGTTQATASWIPELVMPPAGAASSNPASYSALKMPALVLWGRMDTVTPLAQGSRLAGLLSGSKLVVLDGVGHIPQIEDPSRTNEELVRFLKAQ